MAELLATLAYALRRKPLGERHRPSGLDAVYLDGDIDDYLARAVQLIGAARVGLTVQDRERVVQGNAPFLLEPGAGVGRRRTLLMVHGLTDSPFITRDLAAFFQSRGFRVLSLLLPGHGSRPGDLLAVDWRSWVKALSCAVERLSRDGDALYLFGFSLGAALGLHQAVTDQRIRGLFLFSPAFHVHPAASLSCVLQRLGIVAPRLRWVDVQPDEDAFKYESIATNAICQAVRLERMVRHLHALRPVRVPLFIGASADDATVRPSGALALFEQAASAHKRMLYYSRGYPDLPDGVRLVPSTLPERRIISSAHTALIIAPDNPHYGEDGDYTFCTHYYRTDSARYARCKTRNEDALGEIGLDSRSVPVVRRLTYNPWYDDLLDELGRFIDGLP